jgi:hypothetical protein
LIKQEYDKLTKDARMKQRTNCKDSAKYLSNMNEYILNSEVLIIEGQKFLAKKLGLSDMKFEDSELLMI